MSEQPCLLVGTGCCSWEAAGGCSQAAPSALSWDRADPLAPVFPRSPWGMLSHGLPDLCAAILSEHLRQLYFTSVVKGKDGFALIV